ncbi:MAG: GFA family protein [Salinisphaera sp.]|uniref:GFA family protein n=1 Tax=Salinisphaera sp. TaxID=1914330 RepID=UPI003C7C2090
MRHEGGCACGGVRFSVDGELAPVVACHCESCRRWSGCYWAAIEIPRERFTLTESATLAGWASSPDVLRQFCRMCGSSLFFDDRAARHIEIAPGAFDQPTGQTTIAHIYCAEAGDYYPIDRAARRYADAEPLDGID